MTVPATIEQTGRRSFRRAVLLLATDLAWWVTAVAVFIGDRTQHSTRLLVAAPVLLMVSGVVTGVHRGRHRLGSFEEFGALATMVGIALVLTTLVAQPPIDLHSIRRLVGLAATALIFTMLPRYVVRLSRESSRSEADAIRYLVFGAGEGGALAIRMMLRNSGGECVPVAILDDDPHKRALKIMGVPVVGNRNDIVGVAQKYGAQVLLIAAGRADAATIGDLVDAAVEAKLQVRVLQDFDDLFHSTGAVSDFRQLNESDLLGRHRVHTDVAKIADYLRGRRVMVTGAGGSIGSELCRQISRYEPTELVLVDRDESALHAVQLSIEGSALLQNDGVELLDLRDRDAVESVLDRRRPEVIFHAAALKHLPLLERYPAEAVKTNVWATNVLLELSSKYGVARFVNISTDKAADPCSVLGYSKRLTERLTAWWAQTTGLQYMSVRFGNVLMSRGSVMTTFQRQLQAGGPITVTHPDVERYFMTVEEAVELTVQAGAVGSGGEVLILDMGEPVRIADVARRLVAMAHARIEIVFTGLRPGEKLTEDLLGRHEVDCRPSHPLISQAAVPPIAPDAVVALPVLGRNADIIAALAAVALHEPAADHNPGVVAA